MLHLTVFFSLSIFIISFSLSHIHFYIYTYTHFETHISRFSSSLSLQFFYHSRFTLFVTVRLYAYTQSTKQERKGTQMNERVTVLLFRRVPSGIHNPASTISSSKPLLHSGSLLKPHRPLVLKILRILTSSLAETTGERILWRIKHGRYSSLLDLQSLS